MQIRCWTTSSEHGEALTVRTDFTPVRVESRVKINKYFYNLFLMSFS